MAKDRIKEERDKLLRAMSLLTGEFREVKRSLPGDVMDMMDDFVEIQNTVSGFYEFPKDSGEINVGKLAAQIKSFNLSVSTYLGEYDRERMPEEQKKVYDLVEKLSGLMYDSRDMLTESLKAMRINEQFKMGLGSEAENARADILYRKIGPSGHRPTIEECTTMKVGETDLETIYDRMLWMNLNATRMSDRDDRYVNHDKGFYKQTLERLQSEIEVASPSIQAQFATIVMRHELKLKKAADDRYHEMLAQVPIGPNNQPDPTQLLAMKVNFFKDPIYFQARSCNQLKTSFVGSSYADMWRALCGKKEGCVDVNAIPYNVEISDMLNGGLVHDLKQGNLYDTATQLEKVEQIAEGDKANFLETDPLSVFGHAYQRLKNDKEKSSESFDAVRRAAERFAKLDQQKINTIEEITDYRRALTGLTDALTVYKNTHRKKPYTDNGKARVDIVNQMLHAMTEKSSEIDSKFKALKQSKELEITHGANPNQLDVDQLKRLSKLHRNITPIKAIPSKPQFSPKISGFSEFMGKIKHWAYTGITAAFNGTIGNLIMLCGMATRQLQGKAIKDKRPVTELNTDRIPGMEGNFEQVDTSTLKGVISDTRRVPLTWEVPIPENPDQEPTISFNFDQGREGDEVGYAYVKGEDGKWDYEMGHGFVTLEYSKKDPLSGKMQRYRTSFGFYPKGGYANKYVMAGQSVKGMFVPGQLNDDSSHELSVGKKFKASYKQINDVILAAQKYEKDGYNYFKRNCTTFVKDMSDVAGIDLSNILQEVDLTQENKAGDFALLSIFGAQHYSRVGAGNLWNRVGKDDESYQRAGQKMVNIEDINRLDKTEFNVRMKGYAPGHASESVRVDKDFQLHSKKYKGDKRINREIFKDFPMRYFTIAQTQEFSNLATSILEYGLRNGIDVSAQVDGLVEFSSPLNGLICKNYEKAFEGYVRNGDSINVNRISKEEQRQAIIEGVEYINQYLEGLNQIYRDTFKGEPQLNIPFQHMTSVLEHLKDEYYQQYRDFASDSIEYDGVEMFNSEETKFMNSELDQSRDVYDAIRSFKFGKITYSYLNGKIVDGQPEYENMVMSTKLAMGFIQEYGSVLTGIQQEERRQELQDMKKDGQKLTAQQQKELDTITRRRDRVNDFVQADVSLFSDRRFTNEDIRKAFVDYPRALEGVKKVSGSMGPEQMYQSVIFEKAFGGMGHSIEEKINALGGQIQDRLTEINSSGLKPSKKQKAVNGLISGIADEACGIIANEFASRFLKNSAIMDRIDSVVMEDMVTQNPPAPGSSGDKLLEYQKDMYKKREEKVIRMFRESYMNPLLEHIADKMVDDPNLKQILGEDTLIHTARAVKDVFTIENLRNHPKFQAFRDTINMKMGKEWMEAEKKQQKLEPKKPGAKAQKKKQKKKDGKVQIKTESKPVVEEKKEQVVEPDDVPIGSIFNN